MPLAVAATLGVDGRRSAARDVSLSGYRRAGGESLGERAGGRGASLVTRGYALLLLKPRLTFFANAHEALGRALLRFTAPVTGGLAHGALRNPPGR
jgi:hypothetical protein